MTRADGGFKAEAVRRAQPRLDRRATRGQAGAMLPSRRALAALALAPALARAQAPFPARNVSMLVGVAPGGTADLSARLLAAEMARGFGGRHPFVVENRPGAATQIATEALARSAPDGHTLLVAGAPFAINPGLFPRLPYDTARDFAPLTRIVQSGLFCVVPAHGARDLPALLDAARRQQGVPVASAGNGSMSHMAIELLAARSGAPLTHVPYRGTGPALPDVISGQVAAFFDNPSSALPLVREGRLRAIAWTGETRSAAAPEVPTVAEAAGLPGFRAVNWFGLFARSGTPEPVLEALHAQALAALAVPEVAERFARDAVEVAPLARADFARFVTDEMAVWAEVIRTRGITPG
jgi:tripartite-type tricarboxylate transporter receptor subunit TctC